MVCDMFRKDDEGHGDIGDGNRSDIGSERADLAEIVTSLKRFYKAEIRQPLHILEFGEIDNFERVHVRGVADSRKDRREGIAREDTDDEREQPEILFTVYRAGHRHRQSHESADQSDVGRAYHFGGLVQDVSLHQIPDGVSGEGKPDDGDGGTDDDGGHELIHPLYADEFHDDGDDDVYESRESGSDNEAEIADGSGDAARESGRHRAEEGEGGAEEHGASELCKQKIHDRAYARAEQSGGSRHIRVGELRVYGRGNGDGSGENCQELLQGGDEQFAHGRSVFYFVNELHNLSCLLGKMICTASAVDFCFQKSFPSHLDCLQSERFCPSSPKKSPLSTVPSGRNSVSGILFQKRGCVFVLIIFTIISFFSHVCQVKNSFFRRQNIQIPKKHNFFKAPLFPIRKPAPPVFQNGRGRYALNRSYTILSFIREASFCARLCKVYKSNSLSISKSSALSNAASLETDTS